MKFQKGSLEVKSGGRIVKIKRVVKVSYEEPVPVYDIVNAFPYNNFFVKSNSSYIVSHNSKIMGLYTNIRRRMDSRFMVDGKNYGKMFLVSSKSTDSSFLEAYIADQVKKGYPIHVVDKPLWEVKPAAYSGKRFKVAVGNKFIPSRIIRGTEEEVKEACEGYEKQGMRIIEVPEEHLQAFDQNIDKALQDIAGISTSVVTKVFSMQRIEKCISEEYENPFRTEVVTLGTQDDLQLRDFFDASRIPDFIKTAPLFIHLDASVSGDRTGISGVAIVGSKKSVTYGNDVGEETITDELVCQQVFTVGIQAPTDAEISFEKTRQFIYYLHKEVGLNIKLISTDGFQSVDLRQIFDSQGYKTGYTSLDRRPDGYDSLKSGILDRRIILLKNCKQLWDELTDLEKDNMKMKYDHPVGGRKDEADSLAGAYLDALQYKDEFMFFHPDDFEYEGINGGDGIDADYQEMVNAMISSLAGVKKGNNASEKDIALPDNFPSVIHGGTKEASTFFQYYDDDSLLLF